MREPAGSNAGGFTFDLCKRNAYLADKGVKAPGVWKTGTTIAGVIYKARPCSQAEHCYCARSRRRRMAEVSGILLYCHTGIVHLYFARRLTSLSNDAGVTIALIVALLLQRPSIHALRQAAL